MQVTRAMPRDDEAEAALQRVLDSAGFVRSKQQQRLLRYLVEATLAGRTSGLKESVLAIEVFDRPADRFDPTKDTIVRVEARRLRQRLARYYAGPGEGESWEFSLPVGAYVPQIRRRGSGHGASNPRRARDLVERGDHFLRQGQFEAALLRYEEAVRECEDYPPAHLGVARTQLNLGMSGISSAAHVPHALASLERSLALEPMLPEALALKGLIVHRFGHDWAGAEALLERAVQLAPNSPRIRDLYGFQLMFAGLHESAQTQLQRARELDPHNPAFRLHMAWLRVAQRRWGDAEREFHALLDVAPDNPWARLAQADMMLYQGRCELAMSMYREVGDRCPNYAEARLGEACAWFGLGRTEEGARIVQQMGQGRWRVSQCVLAEAMAAGRRYDEAITLLQRSAEERDSHFLVGTVSALFDPLHADPRFEALYRSSRTCAGDRGIGPESGF